MTRARGAGRIDGAAWVLSSAFLALAAIAVTVVCALHGDSPAETPLAHALDWQPALGLREPWRLWTCAVVHGSGAHLLVNLAGCAVLAFVGWRARLPAAAAIAWMAAWPGTQLVMAAPGAARLAAAMPHYYGLSGVLHAGVAVLGLWLAWPPAPASTRASAGERPRLDDDSGAVTRARWIGVAILGGTLAKVVLETPWHPAPRASEALGIAVAPVGHACGICAGLLAGAIARRVVGNAR